VARPHWGTTDQIAYLSNPDYGEISLVAATGGSPPRVLGEARSAALPFLLPDGSAVLAGDQVDGLLLLPTNGDSARQLVPGARHGRYIEPGFLVYVDGNGDLFAQRFDLKRGEVMGSATKVLDRVATYRSRSGFAISSGGTMVHLNGEIDGPRSIGPPALVVASFAGAVDTLPLAAEARRADLRISPDGRLIAYTHSTVTPERTLRDDIALYDLVTGAITPVTSDGLSSGPTWSPDGTELLFGKRDSATAGRDNDLYVVSANRSQKPRRVLALPGDQVANDWPARDTIVFETRLIDAELFVLSLADGAQPRSYLGPRVDGWQLRVAPGGSFATLTSWRDEHWGVYVRDYPAASREWKLTGGNSEFAPRWAPDGKSVYFWRRGGYGLADTLYQATFDPSARVPVQSVGPVPGVPAMWVDAGSWDIHPDGRRFVVAASGARATPPDSSVAPRYIVTLNWSTDLAAKVAAAGGKP
jgi:hypothetical protein